MTNQFAKMGSKKPTHNTSNSQMKIRTKFDNDIMCVHM